MTATIIYVRLSQDREGAGLGVQRQEQDCRTLANDAGWDVDGVIIDNDMSASGRKPRPGYLALLRRMQAGEVARVIAWHTDRLHRSPLELEEYVTASEQHHIVTRTVKAGELDLATPAGRMVARVYCAIARHEVEHKSERQKRAELQRAEAGHARVGGLRAYGYGLDRKTVVTDEAAVIRDAAERLLSGESLRSVCDDLNRRQVPTVTGPPWQPTVLRSMLLRPRLAGLSTYRGKVVGKGEWEPILTEQKWRALSALMTDPDRRTGTNARRHLLTGIAVCDACGTPVTIHVGSSDRPEFSRSAYECRICRMSRSSYWVDLYVTEAVIAWLERVPIAGETSGDPEAIKAREELEARLGDAAERFALGDITGDQMTLVSRRLRAELAKLAREDRTARTHMLSGMIGPSARESFEAASLSVRRAIIAEVVEVRLARSPGRTFRQDTIHLAWR